MNCRHRTVGAILGLLIVLVLLASGFASTETEAQKSSVSGQGTNFSVSPYKGPADAPVVIVVFSDFQ